MVAHSPVLLLSLCTASGGRAQKRHRQPSSPLLFPYVFHITQVLLDEEREAMAKSRRLERSTSSFSYSSYHTLEEVGVAGQALGFLVSLVPLGFPDSCRN